MLFKGWWLVVYMYSDGLLVFIVVFFFMCHFFFVYAIEIYGNDIVIHDYVSIYEIDGEFVLL